MTTVEFIKQKQLEGCESPEGLAALKEIVDMILSKSYIGYPNKTMTLDIRKNYRPFFELFEREGFRISHRRKENLGVDVYDLSW